MRWGALSGAWQRGARWLWPLCRRALGLALASAVAYLGVLTMLGVDAHQRLAHPPQGTADAALILGNRAYLYGRPNPCLTGRVDAGIALARAGTVGALLFSGGRDLEDGHIEAEVMQQHAQADGFTGSMLLEPTSTSTRENLAFSRALLLGAGARSVVIVTEPYHLWRVQRLVQASGFDQGLQVQYAAAPTACWRRWGMAFKGALREPMAVAHNFLHGYY